MSDVCLGDCSSFCVEHIEKSCSKTQEYYEIENAKRKKKYIDTKKILKTQPPNTTSSFMVFHALIKIL